MNKKMAQSHSLPVAGPVIVGVLIILALVFVPPKSGLKAPESFFSSELRIDSLEDSQLAGNVRPLSNSFDPGVKMDFRGSKRYDLYWDEFEIFNVKAFAPRLPVELLSDLEKISDPTPLQINRLLDLALRFHDVQGAITRADSYVNRFPDNQDIKEATARFFENRLMPKRAIEIHDQRFTLLLKNIEKEDTIRKKEMSANQAQGVIAAIDSLREAYLISGDTDSMLRTLIDSCAEKPDLFFDYVNRLIEKKQYQQAWEFLTAREKGYKEKQRELLKAKAKILEGQEQYDKAILVYDSHPQLLDSKEDIFSDFLALLARTHRTESWRKTLLDRTKENIDIPALKRLSAYYFRNGQDELFYEQIKSVEKQAREKGIEENQLKELAELCMDEGSQALINKAALFRWNLFLLAKNETSRSQALVDLAGALVESNQPPPFPAGATLPGAPVIGFLDRYPGLSGGALSLDLNLRGTKERFSAAVRAGRKYENMRIALHLVEPLIQKGSSEKIASSATLTAIDIYARLKLDQRFLEVAQAYLKRFPNGKSVPHLLWSLADYYHKKDQFEDELAQYMKLLKFAKSKNDDRELVRVRKRIVDRMVAKKLFSRVLPFYWEQIDAEKDDEKLLLEFIDFCKRHRIFKDTIQAYEIAAERFHTSKYSDKLARYLLSWKKRNAFEALTASLFNVLLEYDFQSYLNRHVYYGSWNSSESVFFEKMYQAALQKYPHNFRFFDKLHSFYRGFEKKHPEALKKRTELLVKYFAVYPKASNDICLALAKQGKLDDAVAQLLTKKNLNPLEMRLLARGLGYLSEFEAQYYVMKQLESTYREKELSQSLASLERSLDSSFNIENPAFTETAARRYSGLAKRYPTNLEYATLAGEVFVEAGKQKSAAKSWEKILQKEPGKPDSYLELATLYWDYYLYELGLSVIEQGRRTTNDPLMLAKEAAYLYESMKRKDLAIEQYVKVICSDGNVDWEVAQRLVYLRKDKATKETIDKVFEKYLRRPEAKYTDVLNYGMYLGYYEKIENKTELFKKFMNSYSNDEYLTTISDYFSGLGFQDQAQATLERLAERTGRTTDVLLRLLAFYETNDKEDEIENVCDELERKNGPGSLRHEEILLRTAQARWERDLYFAALNGYRQWALLGKGAEKDQRLYEYALRCLEGGEPESGIRNLMELAEKYPERTKYYREIAQYYGDAGEYEKLVSLYKEAITETGKASISRIDKKNRIEAHRRSMANALIQLEKYTEALDQYIEIINSAAPDRGQTDEVFRFAQTRNQMERLVGYYKKLSEKSYKDFRWQLVLGDLFDKLGESQKAAIQYEKAIRNEPQRLYIYDIWAGALQKANDVDGALKVLERRYELSGTANDLRRVAEYAFSAGKREKAIELLLKLVDDPKTPTWRLFEVVNVFDKNREHKLAYDLAVRALNRFKTNPVKMDIQEQQLNVISTMTARRFGFSKSYQTLWTLWEWLVKENNSKTGMVRNRLKSHARVVENALAGHFAKYVFDYSSLNEFNSMQVFLIAQMQSRIEKVGTGSVNKVVEYYLKFAKNAGMNGLRLATLKAKADVFKRYANDSKRNNWARNATNAYLDELRWRGDLGRVLSELTRLDYSRFYRADYAKTKAGFAFMTGDAAAELQALELLYQVGRRKSFARMDDYHVRYLDLLWESDQTEFRSLVANTTMPGFMVGYCTWKNLPDLAINALNLHWKNPESSWSKRRKIQVYEYAGKKARAKELYGSVLGYPRIIQTQEEGLIDRNAELTGQRWFEWANRYGKLLLSMNDPSAQQILSALPEKSPKNISSYLNVAVIYNESKKFDKAFESIALAESLSGENDQIIRVKAAVFLKMGDKQKAAAEYEKLLKKDYVNIYTYRTYYNLMDMAGMGRRALDKYQRFLATNFNKLSRYDQVDEAKFMTEKLGESPRAIQFLRDTVTKSPQMLYLVERITQDRFLPSSELGWFHGTGTNKVLQSPKTSVSSKLRWVRRSIEFAMKQRDLALGQKMIQAARELDKFMGAKGEYDLKEAELELRCIDGKVGQQKIFALAAACKDRYEFDDLVNVARRVKNEAVAKLLHQMQLKKALDQNDISDRERIELAKYEFENGSPQNAEALLEYVASNFIENTGTLASIAKVYINAGLAQKALAHIQRAVTIMPASGSLKILQGIAMACTGETAKGAGLVAESFSDGSVSRSDCLELMKESKGQLDKNSRTEIFADEISNIEKTGAKLFYAFLCLEADKPEKALEAFSATDDTFRYQFVKVRLQIKAFKITNSLEKELETLNRAIRLIPHDKQSVADRFFVLMKLGQPANALDSIEKWLPAKRYPLLQPTSRSSSASQAKGLPGKLGLSDKQADRMLELTADAFLAINRPAQAKVYLQTLEDRLEGKPEKVRVSKRIKQVDSQIETYAEKVEPWPVITNER